MTYSSKTRLLASSAVASLAIMQLAPAAHAQDAFGIHNDEPGLLEILVEEGETVEGEDIGIYADDGPVDVDNAGEIRGNGDAFGGVDQRPSGGIVIAQADSTVVNSGTIVGGAHGITTSYYFSEDADGENLPPEALAANTSVTNSGLIRGLAGNGVSLLGGGDVVNSGTIQGYAGGNGALGIGVVIAEFPEATRTDVTGVGTLTNTQDGLIEGQLYGVLLSGGGTIDNDGTIRSFGAPVQNVTPFGIILTANEAQTGREATVNNTGTVSGLIAVLANQSLELVTINNDGLIQGNGTGIIGLNSGELIVNNGADGQILATATAIASNAGTLTVDNAGLIQSNNQQGINITTAGAVIDNSGTIQGGTFGITTNPFQVSPGVFEDRSIDTTVTNSGSIIGLNNDGIRLQGGGTVSNSGLISGRQNVQADGVSIFALQTQDLETYGAVLTNSADGTIDGNRFGVIISAGGTVENAGSISGGSGGVVLQNGVTDAELNFVPGIVGAVTNSGDITGAAGSGVSFGGGLESASVVNSGTIAGNGGEGVQVTLGTASVTTIDNGEDGEIVGSGSGIDVVSGGLALTNAGTIRGEGRSDGTQAPSDGGVSISGSSSTIVNSGEISGAQFGIVTQPRFDAATGTFIGTAVNTTIENSGTITGENDDGIRLAGGGTVTNSGTIQGLAQNQFGGTDGVSMFPHTDQANDDYSALVRNGEGGTILGQRFGVILSSGGDVVNGGEITGGAGGIFVQGTALNTDESEDRSGLTASVVNTGTITGTGNLGGTGGDGYGVGFGSDMSTATLVNSGTINSEFGVGVSHGSLADLTVTNEEGGVISGATSGIYGGASGTLAVVNAGTIRGEGSYDGFDAPPDAGITIGTADSSVVNTGTISSAGAGITTAYLFDASVNGLVFLAAGTTVTNSGTIAGESNDGVRLIGGGSVTNSGTISGTGSPVADGVSMFRADAQRPEGPQPVEGYVASVANSAEGEISGDRFGVILSGGGAIDNAGSIEGGLGGVVIQSQFDGEDAGLTATLTNSGTITGATGAGAEFNAGLEAVVVTNSGTISGATLGLGHGTDGAMELVNSGTIAGGTTGVESNAGGGVTLVNSGSITGETGAAFTSVTQTALDNAGVLSGGNGVAVLLGGFDDTVILRTGSDISGTVDAGEGVDSLTLAGEVLELTEAQELGSSLGFESLTVGSGYWSTVGLVGEFGSVTIGEGATLQVNEVDLGDEEGFASPIATNAVTTNGLLVLNFSEDEIVSGLDALAIDGAGGIQLIGEAVFTVDTASLTHTGGTTISNGGLVLAGTLLGDVITEGDGYFQLGAGGTEGTFSGDLVNDGRFVFNRSDDYDFLGDFSGSGTLDKLGAGILTFLGDYSFTGVTNIFGGGVRIGGTIDPETDFNLGDGGTLDITGNDQTVGGLSGEEEAVVELGEQTLTVDQEENTEFAGAITGLGSIVKEGEGILNLTGDSTYTGPTEINGGTLAVNGSIVSEVTVNDGGTLGGNGTVGSTTVADGGTVAPGNSIGQLTVAGDLAFAAGSIYEVEVNAAGAADRIDATGAVTIANTASVAVLAEDGNYRPRTDYVILTGADGVTGTFGSVTTDHAFLDPLLRYSANAVTLSLYRNDIDFEDVAVTDNQAGVAVAVQALGINNPLFEAVLIQNAATAQATFGDLSGEILASTITGLTDDSRHLRNALMGMAAPETPGAFVWGSAFGAWGDYDAGGGSFGLDTDHKGFVTGIGFGGDGFAVAVSGGLGGSDFQQDGRGDSADVDSKYLALHATAGSGDGLHGAIGVSYAWHDVATSRAIGGAPLAQTLVSERDANTLQVFGEVGFDLVTGSTAVTPFARVAHVSTDIDGFAEAGGTAALVVADAEQDATFLSLGARARFNAESEGFQPFISAAWNRAFGDRTAVIASRFAAGGPVFATIGETIPRNSAEVEAGFDYTSGAFSIGAVYSGTLASDRTSHGARVTARISF
jgi:autotransporter-associated beta strand protein